MILKNIVRGSAMLAVVAGVGSATPAQACFCLPPGQSLEDLGAQPSKEKPALGQACPCDDAASAGTQEEAASQTQAPLDDRTQAPLDEEAFGQVQMQGPPPEWGDSLVFEWEVDGPKEMHLVFPPNATYDLYVSADNGQGWMLFYNESNDPERGNRDAHVVAIPYEEAGTYEVTIRGRADAMRFGDDEHPCELLQVSDLGDLGWTSTKNMFANCHKLTDVLGGEMSQVTDMSGMFYNAEHATPETATWDVSQVTTMKRMFQGASAAAPDTSDWELASLKRGGAAGAFAGALAAERATADFDQRGFKEHRDASSLDLVAESSEGAAAATRQAPVLATASRAPVSHGPAPLVFEWEVDGARDMFIFVPEHTSRYEFFVDWGNGTVNKAFNGDGGHPGGDLRGVGVHYDAPGTYRVTIWGHADAMQFSAKGHECDLLRVLDLGDLGWTSTKNMFANCRKLTDVRGGEMSQVTDMSRMFFAAHNAKPQTGDWDVSRVTNMAGMFMSARAADPDVANWDMGRVRNLDEMFLRAGSAAPNTRKWRLPPGASANDTFVRAYTAEAAVQDFKRRGYRATTEDILDYADKKPSRAQVSEWMRDSRNDVRKAYESGDFLDYSDVPPPRDVVKKWEREARRQARENRSRR